MTLDWSRMSDHVYHRLNCGHVFCFACLIKLFETTWGDAYWFECPECRSSVFDPPKLDMKIAAAVRWLLLMQGAQTSEVPDVPPNAFDMYFYS